MSHHDAAVLDDVTPGAASDRLAAICATAWLPPALRRARLDARRGVEFRVAGRRRLALVPAEGFLEAFERGGRCFPARIASWALLVPTDLGGVIAHEVVLTRVHDAHAELRLLRSSGREIGRGTIVVGRDHAEFSIALGGRNAPFVVTGRVGADGSWSVRGSIDPDRRARRGAKRRGGD